MWNGNTPLWQVGIAESVHFTLNVTHHKVISLVKLIDKDIIFLNRKENRAGFKVVLI